MRFLILLSLLFLIHSSLGQWWVYEEGDCFESNDKIAELRSILQCSTCRVRPQNYIFASYSMTSASRGAGWSRLAFDQEESNVKDDVGNPFFARVSANQFKALKTGYYQLSYNGVSWCTATCGTWSRVHVNNAPIDYHHWSYGEQGRPNVNKLTWKIGAGQTFHIDVHGGGGDPYRAQASVNGNGRNRFQVSFLGTEQDLPFFSGGCGHHVHAGGWHRLALTIVEHSSTVTKQYLEHYVDGRILVLKDGFYRVTAHIMPHAYDNKEMRFMVNGKTVHHQQSTNRAWRSLLGDIVLALDEDDVFYVETMASGRDPWASHSHATGGHTSRVQVVRVGDLGKYDGTPSYAPNDEAGEGLKIVQGGPLTQHQDTLWHKLKFAKVLINTMPQSDAWVDESGDITIQAAGTYRIHSQAQLHSAGRALKMGKIVLNGQIVTSTETQAGYGWNQHDLDVTLKLDVGDIAQIWWLASGNDPHIHAYNVHHSKTFGEVIKLEY